MAAEIPVRAHLLVVDDDHRIWTMLSRYLTDEGFRVSLAASAAEMRERFQEARVDLVLLDLILPDADGFSLAEEIRAQFDAGIVMITGRSDEIDRIVGLEIGADDYIAKPFSLREVLARVKSVLRRLQPAARPLPGSTPSNGKTMRFDRWNFDLERRPLTAPDGKDVAFTTGEFDILQVLVQHAGCVLFVRLPDGSHARQDLGSIRPEHRRSRFRGSGTSSKRTRATRGSSSRSAGWAMCSRRP